MIDVHRDEFDELRAIVIDGNSLHSDDGERWFLPKKLANTLTVSDIPQDVTFELCASAEKDVVYHDSVPMVLCNTEEGDVIIRFEDTGTRKYWNGLVGFKPYMDTKREVVRERASEVGDVDFENFEDDGDFITLIYAARFETSSCETAIQLAEELATEIEGATEMRLGVELWQPVEAENEKEFTLRVVLPILRKLGFQNVRYNHGKREFGRDVLFARPTEFSELEHWGAQVKLGNISGGANSEIDTIIGQIDDAFRMPFYDIYTRQQQHVSKLAIVISGKFTENAIEKVCEKIESASVRNNVVFIDDAKIETLAERIRRTRSR